MKAWQEGAILGFTWAAIAIFLMSLGENVIFGGNELLFIIWAVPFSIGSWVQYVADPYSEIFSYPIEIALISGSTLFSTPLFFAIMMYLIDKNV